MEILDHLHENFTLCTGLLRHGTSVLNTRRLIKDAERKKNLNPIDRVNIIYGLLFDLTGSSSLVTETEHQMLEDVLIRWTKELPNKQNGESNSVPMFIEIVCDSHTFDRHAFEEKALAALFDQIEKLSNEDKFTALFEAACRSPVHCLMKDEALERGIALAEKIIPDLQERRDFYKEAHIFVSKTPGPSSKYVRKEINIELAKLEALLAPTKPPAKFKSPTETALKS